MGAPTRTWGPGSLKGLPPCPCGPPCLAPPQGAPQSEPSAPSRLQSPRQQQLTCNGPFSLKDEEGVGQRLTLQGRAGKRDSLQWGGGGLRAAARTGFLHPLTCVSVRCPILLNKFTYTTYHTPGTLPRTFTYVTQLILQIPPGKEVLS